VLLSFHAKGWVNEYGVDFTKVRFELISKSNWEEFVKLWIETISPVPIHWSLGVPIYEKSTINSYSEKDSTCLAITSFDKTVQYYKRTGYFNFPVYYISFKGKSVNQLFRNSDGTSDTRMLLPISKLEGDTYIRSSRPLTFMRASLVGNESTICLFLEEEKRLVQLDLDMVNFIQQFLQ